MRFNLSKTHGRVKSWVPQSTPPKTAPFFQKNLLSSKNLRNLIPATSRQFFGKENFKESFLYQTGVADSEKRTPEAKFRPFFSNILDVPEFQKNHFATLALLPLRGPPLRNQPRPVWPLERPVHLQREVSKKPFFTKPGSLIPKNALPRPNSDLFSSFLKSIPEIHFLTMGSHGLPVGGEPRGGRPT